MYGPGHRSVHSDYSYPPYLQVRHPLLKGVGVFPQGLLLLQELGVPSFSSRLEEAVVVNVPQWLVERADDLLFSIPHVGVQIKLETPLTGREHRAAWRSEVWTPRVLDRILHITQRDPWWRSSFWYVLLFSDAQCQLLPTWVTPGRMWHV